MIESECCETTQKNRQFDLPPYLLASRPCVAGKTEDRQASLPGDHRALEPPDPIPNSVVKRCIADGSVEFLHVRVGHRQASKKENPCSISCRGFVFLGCEESLLHNSVLISLGSVGLM